MREFAFTVRFEEGADPLMDLFLEADGLTAQSRHCFAHDGVMWRIDDVYGPAEALDRFDALYLDETTCNECLDAERCDSTREYEVLERGEDYRVVYTHRKHIEPCHSIPTLALEEIGDGLVLEATRNGPEYTWIVLMPDDTAVGQLYDRVNAELRPGLSLELGHISEVTDRPRVRPDRLLSPDERTAVEAAVEADYYGIPRGTTVSELATELDTPRSTVQHRLQRAEAKLVEQYCGDTDPR